MLTVACVLRSGGAYKPQHVSILESMVREHLPNLERFVCLTDVPMNSPGVECIKLQRGFPGWWSKIEAFSGRIAPDGDRILYLDLDSIIVGDLSDIASRHEAFLICGDVYRRPPKSPKIGYQSALMMWTAGTLGRVYSEFTKTPQHFMNRFKKIGDQAWIERMVPSATFWETVLPGQVVSFKKHCVGGVPGNARVVIFHGVPRPWQVHAPWAVNAYREAVHA